MSNLIELLRAIFTKSEPYEPLSKGFYSYHTPEGEDPQYRLHLRIDKDGEGIMVVNASSVLHLNQTATEFAYHLMQGKKTQEVAAHLAKRFNAPMEQILKDVNSFQEQIHQFILRSDQEPITNFGFEPHLDIQDISAPYRLDCCLTYRSEDNLATTGPNAELTAEEWKSIIKKSFNAGIPQLIFFGGEPTLRPDLNDLLACAEELGLVTGLVSHGSRLQDPVYVQSLISSGLDHLVFEYTPGNVSQEQALEIILPLDLFTCVELNLDAEFDCIATLDRLTGLGANAFSVHSSTSAGHEKHLAVLSHLELTGRKLVTDNFEPLFSAPDIEGGLAASETVDPSVYVSLRVLPDGGVLTGGDRTIHMGNLLREDWNQIWDRRVIADEIS